MGLLTLTGLSPAAGAELSYSASVNAWGVRVSETIPSGPGATDTLFDGGGPTAMASAGTEGTSYSFASHPYPGPVLVGLPAVLAGSAPQAPRLPDYPYYVEAAHPINPRPDPKAAPGGILAASAGPGEASAQSEFGVGDDATALGHYEVRGAVTRTADSAVAKGTSTVRGLRVGPITIASLESSASATLQGDGQVARESMLTVTGLTIDGQGLSVDDGAIVLADTKVPLADSASTMEALAGAGIEIAYLAERETDAGVASAALAISRQQETPDGGSITVQLILGQVIATINGSATPDSSVVVGDESIPAEDQSAAGAATPDAAFAPGPAANAQSDPVTFEPEPAVDDWAYPDAPPVILPDAGTTGNAAPAGDAPGDESVQLAQPLPAVGAALATANRGSWSFDTRSSYLALAAAVAVVVAVQLAFTTRKWRWNS